MFSEPLRKYIENVQADFNLISDERKEKLHQLSSYISKNLRENARVNLIFICTHNSRRSHFSQIWAQVAAIYYKHYAVSSYSGGTEATVLFPAVLDSLKKTGINVESISKGENPIYAIKFDDQTHPIIGFSKKYNDIFNPSIDFAAVMTCTDADENCPFIPGATRISLPFEDPKVYDSTPIKVEKYDERCRQVALELFYAFSNVKV